MRRFILIIGIAMSLPCHASDDAVTGEEVRDQIIEAISDSERDEHTCRRVRELGKGTVSDEECIERLKIANAECLKIAKENVPRVQVKHESKFLVEILMGCPVAKVLDIGLHIVDGKVHIQWEEIDEKTKNR